MPGFKRAKTRSDWPVRSVVRSPKMSGVQISAAVAQKGRKLEAFRHDSDDAVRYVVDLDFPADHIRASEGSLPKRIGNQNNRLGSIAIFVMSEGTTLVRRHAEQGKHVCGYAQTY